MERSFSEKTNTNFEYEQNHLFVNDTNKKTNEMDLSQTMNDWNEKKSNAPIWNGKTMAAILV